MSAPLEVICDQLELAGVREMDAKTLLLGYLLGRGWDGGHEETLRRTVANLYPPRRKVGSAPARRASAPEAPASS